MNLGIVNKAEDEPEAAEQVLTALHGLASEMQAQR